MVDTNEKRPLALVTGASRGIGEAIARKLAEEGYDLILTCSSSISDLQQVADSIRNSFAVSVRAHQVDMASWEQVEALFSEIGSLDVLINNAGISHVGLLTEMSAETWHRIMGVNLDSVFYTCKCAAKLMLREHAGRIVNISSVWGNVGASMEVAYSASKGGVNSFTKALAKELAPSHIAVNAVACGLIRTRMNACFSEEDLAAVTAEIPADRMGEPEEVAQLVAQLLQSPLYVTGQIVTMDGGWT